MTQRKKRIMKSKPNSRSASYALQCEAERLAINEDAARCQHDSSELQSRHRTMAESSLVMYFYLLLWVSLLATCAIPLGVIQSATAMHCRTIVIIAFTSFARAISRPIGALIDTATRSRTDFSASIPFREGKFAPFRTCVDGSFRTTKRQRGDHSHHTQKSYYTFKK
jgi:hypothetical protein